MNISNASANLNLSATGTTTRPGYVGSVSINSGVKASYSTADQAYQTFFLLAGTTTAATLNMTTGDAAGDAWVAPVVQVETATASGVTGSGNAKVTITAAGLVGSPLDVSVAVLAGDTPAQVASKISAELQYGGTGTAEIGAFYDVAADGSDVVFTRKTLGTYTVGSETIIMANADDATMNVAIDNDTSTGITPAPTSASTTAGVEADGVFIWNDDIDFEGRALASPAAIYALAIDHSTEYVQSGHTLNWTVGTEYKGRMKATTDQTSHVLMSYPDAATILDTLTLTGTSDTGLVTVTVVAVE